MSIELLQKLSMISYIIAGLAFLTAIALFFILDIRKVIGDISGSTARKAIENIRNQNEKSGDKAYKPSPVNAARGKLTDKISASGRLIPQSKIVAVSTGTEKFNTLEMNPPANETTVLNEITDETTILTMPESNSADSSKREDKYVFYAETELSFAESLEIIE